MVLREPRTDPVMKTAVTALVCLLAVVAAEPEPHVYHPYHHPYHHHHLHHHVKPLSGEGVAYHPGGGTSFVAPQVHGLTKRSADPDPNADPEPAADPHNSYSYQQVHHGHHYPLHHGYRYGHYYGYPYHTYAHHVHHKRSADPEPEPHYSRPYHYGHYYHGYPSYYRYPHYRGYYHG